MHLIFVMACIKLRKIFQVQVTKKYILIGFTSNTIRNFLNMLRLYSNCNDDCMRFHDTIINEYKI